MRRFVFLTIGALFGINAFGQDLLECVNPDVLTGLIFRGEQSTVISTAVPAEIAGIDIPGQFSWIGSAERNLGRVVGDSNLSVANS